MLIIKHGYLCFFLHVFSFKQNTNLVSDFESGADEHLETLKFNQPKVSGIPSYLGIRFWVAQPRIRTCNCRHHRAFPKKHGSQLYIKMDPWPFSELTHKSHNQEQIHKNTRSHGQLRCVYIYISMYIYICIYHVCQFIQYIYIYIRYTYLFMCCWICDHLKPSCCREEPNPAQEISKTALRWIEIVVGRPGEIAERGEAKKNMWMVSSKNDD